MPVKEGPFAEIVALFESWARSLPDPDDPETPAFNDAVVGLANRMQDLFAGLDRRTVVGAIVTLLDLQAQQLNMPTIGGRGWTH